MADRAPFIPLTDASVDQIRTLLDRDRGSLSRENRLAAAALGTLATLEVIDRYTGLLPADDVRELLATPIARLRSALDAQ
jgi:hypothetical protein